MLTSYPLVLGRNQVNINSMFFFHLQVSKKVSVQHTAMLLLSLLSIFPWSILSFVMECWDKYDVPIASNRHLCHRSHCTFKSYFSQVQCFKLSKRSMKKGTCKRNYIMDSDMIYQRKYTQNLLCLLELNHQWRLYEFHN